MGENKELIDDEGDETISYHRNHDHDISKVEINSHKIPVIGVLTEPIRG